MAHQIAKKKKKACKTAFSLQRFHLQAQCASGHLPWNLARGTTENEGNHCETKSWSRSVHRQTLDRAHMIMEFEVLSMLLAHVSVTKFTLGVLSGAVFLLSRGGSVKCGIKKVSTCDPKQGVRRTFVCDARLTGEGHRARALQSLHSASGQETDFPRKQHRCEERLREERCAQASIPLSASMALSVPNDVVLIQKNEERDETKTMS